MKLYTIIEPTNNTVPIILSVPHAGTKFPVDIKKKYDKRLRKHLDDTDWFVHQLYDFAPSLGITVIKANLSRWVIDLNRDPKSVPLYNDDRLITSITPTTDFFGNAIYKSSDLEPNETERTRRLNEYYWPYYDKIETLLTKRKKQFGQVLLWDAHSIRHKVSTIQKAPFPDMILGNDNTKTASSKLIDITLNQLRSGDFEVSHNNPFKGGHITRYFGNPSNSIHALQLEMNKILYMDDNEITYNSKRALKVQKILKSTFRSLLKTMQ